MKKLLVMLILIPGLANAGDWEFCRYGYPAVYRYKIGPGWLVMAGFCVTYIPDPDHSWDCINEK